MSDTLFQLLLKLYPRCFRAEYGDAMRLLFRDRTKAETGFINRVRLWADLLRDLAISVPREHQRTPRFASAESQRYRISEEGLRAMVRNHRRRLLFAFVPLVAGFLTASFGQAALWPTYFVYGLASLLIIFLLRNVESLKDHWRDYEVVLNEGCIRQRGHNGSTLTLTKAEIVSVFETGDLGLAIRGHDLRKSIWVPSVLSGYEELWARLRRWSPSQGSLSGGNLEAPRSIVLNKWIVALYPAALLVQSPYFAIPLAAALGVYFLNSTRRLIIPGVSGTAAIRKMSVAGGLLAIVPSALLFLKVIFLLR